jgi:hypothetical protein
MELIIRHQFRDLGNFYVTSFFNGLYKELINNFPQHDFSVKNEKKYENNGYGSIYSCMNFSIVNPINQKYILFSFFDNWKYHFMRHLGWNPSKMVQFFYPGGFNYIDYFHFKKQEQNNNDVECPSDINNKYHSFFYGPYENGSLDLKDELFNNRSVESTIPALYFKGYLWDFRKQIISHSNDPSILIIDKNIHDNNLSYQKYLQELSQYRCALSLPGGTEICNRDIECFAVGVPVLRPFLNVCYPDPLIPNYHYISFYTDCKYWDGNPSYLDLENGEFIRYLEHYWNIVKHNIEYLNFVGNNARDWFVKNCTLKNNISYILSQINLESLNG